jgi:hypothetical protein
MPKQKKKIADKIADKVVEVSEKVAKIAMEEEWFPPTKKMPCKPIRCDGDATFCATCSSNTTYKGICAICGIKPSEIRLKHVGEINYLREKYPLYCR